MEAVRQNGLALEAAGIDSRADEEIVLMAVQNAPLALEYARYAAHTKEIVLTAVKQDGLAFGFTRHDNHDVEIALTAVRQNQQSISGSRKLCELTRCSWIIGLGFPVTPQWCVR